MEKKIYDASKVRDEDRKICGPSPSLIPVYEVSNWKKFQWVKKFSSKTREHNWAEWTKKDYEKERNLES